MDSGRELDALVAEKVMGILKPTIPGTKYLSGAFPELDKLIPHYSTDIAAAWEIVEKVKFMQPNWKEFGLNPDHHQMFTVDYTGFGWRAGWRPINLDGVMTIEVESDSAPHAICLAALKAVGYEEEINIQRIPILQPKSEGGPEIVCVSKEDLKKRYE